MTQNILAIDQGTTSSRAIAFDTAGTIVAMAQKEFRQIFPQGGWVEHDPKEIWDTTLSVCQEVISDCGGAQSFLGIGITNQRETCLFWDRKTGASLGPAIVWQDRRGADLCTTLKERGHSETITAKTGLLLDSYFSATKAKWILDQTPDARGKAAAGELLFGTIDSYLIWQLTGGKTHATDPTNACRTMLYNIHDKCWDEELLELFDIPPACLPEVKDTADDFGITSKEVFGADLPVLAAIGDQQGALVGQACFQSGDIKSTYGTGCFLLMNTGDTAPRSQSNLLTSIGYRLKGQTTYVLEGSIFNAGTAVQWLRDEVGLIAHAAETEVLAKTAKESSVYFVPAFTGLGAPYWDPHARGAILGLTRDTNKADIVRAGLESVCFQTQDLMAAMVQDTQIRPHVLRVDGGMTANNWLLQVLSDITQVPVERPKVTETTALGAALLAALKAGVFSDLGQAQSAWTLDQNFSPSLAKDKRDERMAGWHDAVKRTLSS